MIIPAAERNKKELAAMVRTIMTILVIYSLRAESELNISCELLLESSALIKCMNFIFSIVTGYCMIIEIVSHKIRRLSRKALDELYTDNYFLIVSNR